MILPTKSIPADMALLSVGGEILGCLTEPMTVSRLWAILREHNADRVALTFDWFVLALDLLFTLGALEYSDGRICRVASSLGVAQ